MEPKAGVDGNLLNLQNIALWIIYIGYNNDCTSPICDQQSPETLPNIAGLHVVEDWTRVTEPRPEPSHPVVVVNYGRFGE